MYVFLKLFFSYITRNQVRLKLFYIDQPYLLDEGKAVVKYTLYLHNYLLQSFVKRSTSLTTTPMERSAVKS